MSVSKKDSDENTNKIQSNEEKEEEKSYLLKTRNTYLELTEKYNDIFKKFVNNDSNILTLTKEEKKLFFKGIKDITNYIYDGFLYMFNISKKGYLPREKILIAIYNKIINSKSNLKIDNMEYYYSNDKVVTSKDLYNSTANILNKTIRDKIEFAVFCALGIENYNNRRFIWDKNRQKEFNFLYFVKNRVAAIILEEFLKNEIEFLNHSIENEIYSKNQTEEKDRLSGKELIELSGYKWAIPMEYYDNIVDFLDGKIDESELILGMNKTKKILKIIYKGLKEKGYIKNKILNNEKDNEDGEEE